jgi:hypothetical protein
MRSKKSGDVHSTSSASATSSAVEMSPNRYGLVLETSAKETGVISTPYYMSDLYREGSAEKKWIESLRKGHGLPPPPAPPEKLPQVTLL